MILDDELEKPGKGQKNRIEHNHYLIVDCSKTSTPLQFTPDSCPFLAIGELFGLAVEFQWVIIYNLQIAITLRDHSFIQ